ncbi:MAG: hypothetical protein ABI178_03485 [Rhodanobacter sp.]
MPHRQRTIWLLARQAASLQQTPAGTAALRSPCVAEQQTSTARRATAALQGGRDRRLVCILM